MDLFLRFTLTVTLLVGTIFGLGFAQPTWLEALGLDFWRFAEYQQILEDERQRSRDLEATRVELISRAKRKQSIIRNLIQGNISLETAQEGIRKYTEEVYLERGIQLLKISGENRGNEVRLLVIYWAKLYNRRWNLTEPATLEHRLNLELQQQAKNSA